MFWLVEIDNAVADGTLSKEAGAELKRRGRQSMVDYAINVALFAGVLMVLGGTAAWLQDRLALAAVGSVLALLGAAALVVGGARTRLVANATAIIGTTLAFGASTQLLFEGLENRIVLGCLLGLPCVALGLGLRRAAPEKLSVLGSWIVLLGAGIHIAGIVTTKSELSLDWLVLHYVAAVIIACGLLLDVRFVTGLAIVPLAAALSSRAFYRHAAYFVAIYEVTLTIVQMAVVASLALLVSVQCSDRISRHARILGQLALIWINVAFWIGSLWGDVVGSHLWGPGAANREAAQAFKASTLVISPDLFSAVWAIGILAVGAWGAVTARRAVLNIAVTFGAIHFYTQYFERLKATPQAFVFAGVIAILAAWALWTFNRRIARGQQADAEIAAP